MDWQNADWSKWPVSMPCPDDQAMHKSCVDWRARNGAGGAVQPQRNAPNGAGGVVQPQRNANPRLEIKTCFRPRTRENPGASNSGVCTGVYVDSHGNSHNAIIKYTGNDLRTTENELRWMKKLVQLCNGKWKDSGGGCAHLIRLYDIQRRNDGVIGMVMEQLTGGKLDSQYRNHMQLLKPQVEAGLRFLHGNGIIHCDIKPDNIMVTTRGSSQLHAVIVDLGAATPINQPALGGTAGYNPHIFLDTAPPANIGIATPQMDFYAWTLTIYVVFMPGIEETLWFHRNTPRQVDDIMHTKFPNDPVIQSVRLVHQR